MAKVLIVDDAPEILEFLAMLISTRKHDVSTAASKKELEVKLSSFVPDVILLDVKLGNEDGREINMQRHKKNT